ncbi:hypothetical protein ACHAXA_009827 [Cyclostephanos tholiformis]|uniref:PDZ domain-containing protein n=1 Tax=Cyclostephanos tholiformis TaxID=382380 RepID=A0ABD3RIS3_9STRA
MTTETTTTNFFDFHAVKNDSLYAPLTASDELCGVGVHLALVHDPPIYNTACPGTTYRYINRINRVDGGSPAERAGLRSGDTVIHVDNTNLDDGQRLYLPEDVADMIRGPEGSKVAVVVERGGMKMEYVLTRAPIGAASYGSRPGSPLPTSTSFMRLITPEADRALDSLEDRTGIDLRTFFFDNNFFSS